MEIDNQYKREQQQTHNSISPTTNVEYHNFTNPSICYPPVVESVICNPYHPQIYPHPSSNMCYTTSSTSSVGSNTSSEWIDDEMLSINNVTPPDQYNPSMILPSVADFLASTSIRHAMTVESQDDQLSIGGYESLSSDTQNLPLLAQPLLLSTDSSPASFINPFIRPLRRIVKTDIRHKLPIMFINTMNSADTQLIDSFLERFGATNQNSSHNIDLYLYHHDAPENCKNVTCTAIPGKDMIVTYFHLMMGIMPDFVFKIDNIILKQLKHNDNITNIQFDFTLNTIHLFPDVTPDCVGKNVEDHFATKDQPILDNRNKKKRKLMDKIFENAATEVNPLNDRFGGHNNQDYMKHLQARYRDPTTGKLPLFKPSPFQVKGRFTMIVNNKTKLIEGIDIYSVPKIMSKSS